MDPGMDSPLRADLQVTQHLYFYQGACVMKRPPFSFFLLYFTFIDSFLVM